MTATEYANGLRELASFVEANPDLVPIEVKFNSFPITFAEIDAKDVKNHAAKTCRALGHVEKSEYMTDLILIGKVGPFSMRVWYPRDEICERVVLGVKTVPATPEVITKVAAVPEREEMVYGWKCSPILGKPAVEVEPEQAMLPAPTPAILEAEYVDLPF